MCCGSSIKEKENTFGGIQNWTFRRQSNKWEGTKGDASESTDSINTLLLVIQAHVSGSVLFSDNQSGPATGVLKFDYFCTEKFGDEVPMRVYYVFVGIIGLCKLTRCYHVIVQSVNTFLLCVSFPAYNSFVYVNESGIWTSETRLQRNFR